MEGGGGDDTFPWHTRGAGAGDHLLSLRSRRSLSTTAATTGEPVVDASSGHHVVEVQPRADDDNGDGSSTMCSPRPGPGVHLVLAFHDLTYSVSKREGGRMKMPLLDGISGEAREGEMVAVLGASGAGKSTLIDALANRIQRGSLRGTVTLNGEALDGRLLRVISAYVMQEDQLHPMLTVTETMMYSAELRLPHSLSASAKRSRVHALIDQLGLGAAANTIIGDEAHRGVSGGERRRVSIGIDIVHNPIILFLDEPTSGLDSTIAFTVVKVLQRIARSGSVVIMSVHQPSHRIIGLLDRLLFLSRGRTVFYGPPSAMPLFFSELGQPIPEGENPAEFALDHIRELEMHDDDDDDDGTEEDELGLLVQFNKSWQKNKKKKMGTPPPMMSLEEAISLSLARGKLLVAADSMDMEVAAAGRSAVVVEVEAYANPPWVEIWILTRRGLTNMRRTKEQLLIRFGAVVLTAFVMATIFGRLDNTPKGVSERFSFFAIAMCTLFFTSADALPVFLLERYIFFRETAHNAYRRSSYTLSNAIVAFLPLLLLSVTFAGITFFSLGLAGGWEGFAFFVLVVLASFWAGSGFVTFVSGVVQHVIIGCAVVAALMCYFMLFSGFFVKRDRIAYYWIWFHYLSLMKYPYEAMMQNEFGADPEKCFMRGVQVFDGTLMGKLAVETQVTVLNAMSKSVGVHFDSSTCVTTGRDILAQQAVDQLGKWGCLWVTFASGFLFRLLFHLTLLLGTKNKRK